jgi:DnaK suppressor protein
MNQSDLSYFKEVLIRQLDQLLDNANHSVINMMDLGSQAPDPLDRATIESGRNYELRIRDRESRLIRKIKNSLEDIANGSYGICELCGGDISIARLKARPVARHCITCKRKMEAYEKVAGF